MYFIELSANKQRGKLQAEATIALLREKLHHLPLDANAEQMFPKALRKLADGMEFGL